MSVPPGRAADAELARARGRRRARRWRPATTAPCGSWAHGEITLVLGWPTERPAVAVQAAARCSPTPRGAAAYGVADRASTSTVLARARGAGASRSQWRTMPAGRGRVVGLRRAAGAAGRHRWPRGCSRSEPDRRPAGARRGSWIAVGRRRGRTGAGWTRSCRTGRVVDDELRYFDVTTPMLDDEAGRTRLDLRLLTSPLPAAVRARPCARFVAPGIVAAYHDLRSVVVDLVGNLLKERLDGLVPDTASRWATSGSTPAITAPRSTGGTPPTPGCGRSCCGCAGPTGGGSAACAGGPTRSCCPARSSAEARLPAHVCPLLSSTPPGCWVREGVSRDDTRREVVVPAPRTVGWQGCSSPAPASARIPRLPARVAPVDVARRVRRAVYLKSLTLKGFKSFASATTLQLEPGITCVVGPNGSGKSNVVDALAWVMGEQGAKSLRGGKMEDVIFAGTSGRPPLGRAEVLLTIDNTDGALPIEYTEVTISRTMFRNGGSEYAINGSPCRLLDVQELLTRLRHRPRDARHRRPGPARLDPARHPGGPARLHRGGRRRPQAPQAQGEGAPQARRHRRQPDPARRPAQRDPPPAQAAGPAGRGGPQGRGRPGRRARRPGPAARRRPGHRPHRARAGARRRDDPGRAAPARSRPAVAEAREAEAALEAALREDLPALAAAQETWFALSGLRERLRGTAVAGRRAGPQRRRHRRADARRPAATPTSSRPRPRGSASRRSAIAAEVEPQPRRARAGASTARRAAEDAAAEEERRVAGLQRAVADRREGLARLHGQVNALQVPRRGRRRRDRPARPRPARRPLARAERAQRDFTALETRVAGLDAGEEGLDAEHEAAVGALGDLEDRLAKAREEAAAGRARPRRRSPPARRPSSSA